MPEYQFLNEQRGLYDAQSNQIEAWKAAHIEAMRCRELATGDELTCDLLPEVVLGKNPQQIGRPRPANLDALITELIAQGIAAAGPRAENLSAAIVNRVEKELILRVLSECDNVQTKAADRLGINRNTLRKKLEEYGLET